MSYKYKLTGQINNYGSNFFLNHPQTTTGDRTVLHIDCSSILRGIYSTEDFVELYFELVDDIYHYEKFSLDEHHFHIKQKDFLHYKIKRATNVQV